MPFKDDEFDLVFANLSIHYFSDSDTKKIISEIKRILKNDGLFIGSVNSIKAWQVMQNEAKEIENHFYEYKDSLFRLFDIKDLKRYLNNFDIMEIEERETVRFEHKKNYIIFVVRNKNY